MAAVNITVLEKVVKMARRIRTGLGSVQSVEFEILLMEEIPNNHQGCTKTCKQWDKLPINWCRISSINSIVWVMKPI